MTGADHAMSPEQESIWLDDQLTERSRYVESWVWRLRGRLDPGAVRRALSAVVARHEPLRSTLGLVDGRPRQTVHPPTPVPFAHRPVAPGGLDAAVRDAVRVPIPLDTPPLLRATLLDAGRDDAVLAVAVHHAAVDGWALRLLDEEFSAAYRAELAGRAPTGAAIAFGTYADRRRAVAAGDAHAGYWSKHLAGAPASSTFPLDRPRPPRPAGDGARVAFRIGAGTVAAARDLCRRLRTTPFTVYAAALAALVARLGGTADTVIGTPVSRRTDEATWEMIACLAEVMPLRTAAAPDASFADLTAAAREAVRGLLRHRDVPFGELVRGAAGAGRDPALRPLFQTVLAVEDAASPGLDLPGVTARRLRPHSGTSKWDSFWELVPDGGGLLGLLEYSTELFTPATAGRLGRRYAMLLADAVRRPDVPLRALDVLPAAERTELRARGGRVRPYTGPMVPESFAAAAAADPDAPAVVHGRRTLSYAALDEVSAGLAGALAAGGHTRMVGVCLDRSPDLAAAVLAVLRSGACCVPLDPSHPPARLARLVRDSGATAVIADAARAAALPLPAGVKVVRPSARAQAPLRAPGAEDPAYLIYTSGSTGEPKGVLVPHRALANLTAWQVRRSAAPPRAATAQFAPIGFDVSFQELCSTWAAGGTLVVVDEAGRRDPGRLLDLLARHRVRRLFLPYVALQQLAEYAAAENRRCPELREVVSAGEQLFTTPAIRAFFAAHPRARLDNQYGPSETHVVTAGLIAGPAAGWPDRPGIGRPVDGAAVGVLDAGLRPVPIGAEGELCVSGTPVGLGYHGDAELTAERFPVVGGERLYRTGDRARWNADGTLRYLGRGDGQVKIRGHRVEPPETEAALAALPGVTAAAVVVTGDGPDRRLAGYYTGAREPADLLRELRAILPAHLVPSVCTPLPSLPLTPSGKVDRAALPAPAGGRSAGGRAPSGPVEERLAGIFAEILGGAPVDAETDFFALGGDSLLAVRLLVRVRAEWGADLDLAAVFAAPSVARLAAVLTGAEATVPDRPAPVLDPAIRPALRSADPGGPGHVLLSGATGFLGAHLLRDLLDGTGAVVHCLVRASGQSAGRERLRSVLDAYGLWRAPYAERIAVVPADLSRPRLGLAEAELARLAELTGAVYHCAAEVNLTASYARLHAVNVDGTAELLRLAAAGRTAPLHHVSTTGVFGPGAGPVVRPGDPLGDGRDLRHGYAQTKWAAERLIEQARERGLPVSVYRPTRICGSAGGGPAPASDFMWLLLAGCAAAGAVPGDLAVAFDLVPVDYVSRAVLTLSRTERPPEVFHIAADRRVPLAALAARLTGMGYRLRTVPTAEWRAVVEADPGNPAHPVLPLIGAGGRLDGDAEGLIRYAAGAVHAVAGAPPPVDGERFRRYVPAQVRASGFPPPPGGGRGSPFRD